MARVTITFEKKIVGRKLEKGYLSGNLRKAIGQTASELGQRVEKRGRSDIKAAGKFGPRWTDGFHARAWARGMEQEIRIFSDVPYFRIFEFGGVIQGKPLLWIPLSFASDAQGVSARDYPGGLFRVDRKNGGAPLLLSSKDGQPKYFGKESVTIPQKFHIRDIAREVMQSAQAVFKKYFKPR